MTEGRPVEAASSNGTGATVAAAAAAPTAAAAAATGAADPSPPSTSATSSSALVPVPGAPAAATSAAAAAAAGPRRFVRQQVPDEVLHDAALNAAIAALPANYNFEVHKTVWRLREARARRVALQLPEGLLMFALTLADILQEHAGVEHVMVMGDVAYGACCVDDFSAAALGADFLVHYGHSCLVPVTVTGGVKCLYVFVDIRADVDHLVDTVKLNFPPGARLLLAGTIQFSSAVQVAHARLSADYPSLTVPKCAPLSPGEVLGCTAPAVPRGDHDALVFVADGRFHLEAFMIANPHLPAYRYDPYGRQMTVERYDHRGMRAARRAAIAAASRARRWGVVLGTLGRQGSPRLAGALEDALARRGIPFTRVLLSELSPAKLEALGRAGIEAWAQVACPRLSIDWGEGFEAAPVLTPYEAMVALGEARPWWEDAEARGGGGEGEGLVAVGPRGAARLAKQQQQQQQQQQCGSGGGDGANGGGGGKEAEDGSDVDVMRGRYPMDYYARDGGPWNGSYHRRA